METTVSFTKTFSNLKHLFWLMILGITIVSCSSEDLIEDETPPQLSEFSTAVSSSPGLEFSLSGTIAEDKGIKSINIRYDNWFLNKTIILDDAPKEYFLNYKFKVPQEAVIGSSHAITITVSGLAANETIIEVNVKLDLDTVNPTLQIASPVDGSFYENGSQIPLSINVSDNFELLSLQVSSGQLNFDETITFLDGENSFIYSNNIVVPQNLEGTVTLEAVAVDKSGNTITKSVLINVGPQLVFNNIYIFGGSTWFGSDATKATRMWQDPNDTNWFIGEFYYTAGNNIKFLGQLGLQPFNWGLNPNSTNQVINSQDSQPIGFPQANRYYRIRFNPYSLAYTFELMTVNVEQRSQMFLMGKGFVGFNLDWNPANGIPMVQDPTNPYVFRRDVQFSDAVELKFLGQNNGWGPYDCGFVQGGETQLPVNYVRNQTGDGSADLKFNGQPGNYRIIFDYFLLRTTIQPIN